MLTTDHSINHTLTTQSPALSNTNVDQNLKLPEVA